MDIRSHRVKAVTECVFAILFKFNNLIRHTRLSRGQRLAKKSEHQLPKTERPTARSFQCKYYYGILTKTFTKRSMLFLW